MTPQVALACMIADYQGLYDQLDITANAYLLAEARECANAHYLRDPAAKVARGMAAPLEQTWEVWKKLTFRELVAANRAALRTYATPRDVAVDSCRGIYDARLCDAMDVEVNVCALEELRRRFEAELEGDGIVFRERIYSEPDGTKPRRRFTSSVDVKRLLHSRRTHGNQREIFIR